MQLAAPGYAAAWFKLATSPRCAIGGQASRRATEHAFPWQLVDTDREPLKGRNQDENTVQLTWKFRETLSAVHAAWCIGCLAQADSRRATDSSSQAAARANLLNPLVKSLREPAQALWGFAGQLQPAAAPSANCAFWMHSARLAASEENLLDYAQRVLAACGADSGHASRLASLFRDLKRGFGQDFPDAAEKMRVRQDPLVQLWQAQGPGLLWGIGKQTSPDLLVQSAEVAVVQPIVSGAGLAHLASNRVQIEAVMTNENPALPEVLRLGWMLSQLDFERPVYSEHLNAHRLRLLAGLAMIPPTLIVAEDVGLAVYQPDTIQLAIAEWFRPAQVTPASGLADVLIAWWDTYSAARPNWTTALTGLARMVDESVHIQ